MAWLLSATPLLAQTPTVVQSLSIPGTHGNPTSDLAIRMPTAVLSGNTVVVGTQAGAAAASVSDDKSNTYTQAGTTCTDGNQPITFWVAKNVTNGPQLFTPHWSSNTTFASAWVAELYNVDQATPVDTVSSGINPTCNHAASGTAITAGSATPTTSGAIAINFAIQDSVATPLTGVFTNGSACGGFTVSLADIVGSIFIQTAITSGACNADATQPTSHAWNSSTLFLRPATAGTAPAASGTVNVRAEQHMSWVNAVCDASPLKVQWRGGQNLWGLRWVGAPNETLGLANGASADPSNSAGGTWTEVGTATQNGASGVVQFWICKSCTTSNTNVITVPYANTCSQDTTLDLMDIQGADITATYAEQHGTGNMLAGTVLTTGTAITPTANNGLVVSFDGHASNTTTAVTTGLFLSAIMTPTPGTSPVDENNMRMIYHNVSSLLPVANIYTNSAAVGVWADKMVFIPPSVVAPTLTSISPTSGNQGATVTVHFVGTNFDQPNLAVQVSGTLVAAGSPYNITALAFDSDFVINGAAALTARNVTASTDGGVTAVKTFTVTASGGGGGGICSAAVIMGVGSCR